ncbi:hypothetical protein CUR97_07970 [Campylobacter jejuni]|nr:hypothetical protein [Campylobacter jejuni]
MSFVFCYYNYTFFILNLYLIYTFFIPFLYVIYMLFICYLYVILNSFYTKPKTFSPFFYLS